MPEHLVAIPDEEVVVEWASPAIKTLLIYVPVEEHAMAKRLGKAVSIYRCYVEGTVEYVSPTALTSNAVAIGIVGRYGNLETVWEGILGGPGTLWGPKAEFHTDLTDRFPGFGINALVISVTPQGVPIPVRVVKLNLKFYVSYGVG